jgi:cytoskeletal protein RodZ
MKTRSEGDGSMSVMRKLELPQRRGLPSRWALIVLLSCVLASMFIAFRAGAQSSPSKPEATTPQSSKPEASKTDASKPGTSKVDSKPGQKLESSATIADDPTIVPDPKESADNNVTFPVDI